MIFADHLLGAQQHTSEKYVIYVNDEIQSLLGDDLKKLEGLHRPEEVATVCANNNNHNNNNNNMAMLASLQKYMFLTFISPTLKRWKLLISFS